MKKVLLSIFSLLFVYSANGQPNAAQSLESVDQFSLLSSLIGKRCDYYLTKAKLAPCKEAVSQMVTILDTGVRIPNLTSYIFVAFKNDYIKLLSTDITTKYLNNLQKEMNDYLLGINPNFNLWEVTLAHYKKTELSSKVLAILFQDTSTAKLHLLYLEKARIQGNASFYVNKDLLSKTIDTMNLLFDYTKVARDFQPLFYPRSLKGTLNRAIYHFYVPMYLSMRLKTLGVSKEMAYTAALLLNLTYEFITTTSDYRYLLADPEKLDRREHDWKIKDIYAGYLGAAMGAGRNTSKELQFFMDSFDVSTKTAVKAMLMDPANN